MTTALTSALLADPPAEVSVPAYDRGAVAVGVVHFGVGSFHRAHQALFLDRVLGSDPQWGICGVGLLPGDARMRDVLSAQDGLYTLVSKSPDGGVTARVVGSIVEYLFAPDSPQRVIDRLVDPAVRIVSLTVTEGGYSVDDSTGEFNPTRPDIAADLVEGSEPSTVFAYVVEALRRRRDAGTPPFTVLSCDNLQNNGDVARSAFLAFARLKDPDTAAWIADHVAFPNSMVDGITPATTPALIAEVAASFGIDDGWPVVSEDYTQWVIEDRFPAGRPDLAAVGVQLVDDVEPYELMKLRMLNASHQAMSYLGTLVGYTYAHEVCGDARFVTFLTGYMSEEAAPTLKPVEGMTPSAYSSLLLRRFSNPSIADTLARLMVDGSARIPKFLLPVVHQQLLTGGRIDHAATVVAGWALFLTGSDLQGQPLEIVDAMSHELTPLALAETGSPGDFLSYRPVFGELGENERFREAYLVARSTILDRGVDGALEALR